MRINVSMRMKSIFPGLGSVWLLWCGSAVGADCFDSIKAELAEAVCTRFAFLSIIESEVFDQVDSMEGTAYIARDGRFNLVLGADRYLFDGNNLYSYSAENNQVIIEKVEEKKALSKEISFITRLDELYQTQVIKADSLYRLEKKAGVKVGVPDSLTVSVVRYALRLDRLEYYDINDERNVVVILNQQLDTICREREFEPDFPDSVEKVRL